MPGLYEGLEDIAFKRVANGYVFQTTSVWLLGAKRRFLVDEAQKAKIAACVRETPRRIKPFVFGYAALIHLLIAAAVIWFVFSGATLGVTVKESTGVSTTTTQSIGFFGAKGVLDGSAGAKISYSVDGPPGYGDALTMTVAPDDGATTKPFVFAFVAGAPITINIDDADGKVVRTAIFVGHANMNADHFWLFVALLTLVFIVLPAIVGPHIYGLRRLRPLLAGLPRSDERITWRENSEAFAARASPKLLLLFVVGGAFGLGLNGWNLAGAWRHDHAMPNLYLVAFGAAASALSLIYFAYVLILRRKRKPDTLARGSAREA